MRRALALSLTVSAVAACGLNQEGVPPPRDRIAYPSGALLDENGRWLFVANSNSDLRYNNGTLVSVDLEKARSDREDRSWKLCPTPDQPFVYGAADEDQCCWDRLDHDILDCDETRYIAADRTIEIGSFAAGMAFQRRDAVLPRCVGKDEDPPNRHACVTMCDDSSEVGVVDGGPAEAGVEQDASSSEAGPAAPPDQVASGRLFVGVRGNSSLTYLELAEEDGKPRFSCGAATLDAKDCAISQVKPEPMPARVPDEPYALYLDPAQDLLFVGHLRGDVAHPDTGGVSLFDVGRRSPTDPPTFLNPSGSLFAADGSGQFGVTSLTRGLDGQLYATSRYVPQAVRVAPTLVPPNRGCLDPEPNDRIFAVSAGSAFVSPLGGSELRGLAFATQTRAFALQRVPPALIGFDVTGGPLGNVPTEILETCQAPTFLDKQGAKDDLRLYVTCFEAGQVYVFDPHVPRLVAVVEVGRGPAGLLFSKRGRARAYVIGFGANNVSVVDLEPGSPTQDHVIQRLGFPSVLPR
jgi:hypothetical protein